MGYTTIVPGTTITASWANANVRDQVVTPFATTSARASAIVSPIEGMLTPITNDDRIEMYDGSAYQRIGHYSSSGRTGGTWTRAANQAINSGTITSISWDTEVADSDGFCTPTSSTITIPAGLGGLYAVSARVTHAWQNNGSLEFMRIVCSSAGTYSWEGDANNAVALQLAGTIVVPLAAAETITVAYLQGTGGAQNVTARIDLYRLGL